MRTRLAVVVALVVTAVAIILWRTSRPTPPAATTSPPGLPQAVGVADARGDARLSAADRARLRDRILAGNAQIAPTDAARLAIDAAAAGSSAPPDGASGSQGSGDTRSPEVATYHDAVFAIADKIVNDCMAEMTDAGNKVEVKYVVIADDDAGGLFENVELPPAGNTSGPNTLECVTERMLGAVLEPPPADIDRFSFSVEVEIIFRDSGAVE